MALSTLDNLFGSDEKKANEGVPIEMGYNSKGEEVIFWIAEINSKKHTAAQRKYEKALAKTRKSEKMRQKVLCKVVAEGILLKWQGMLDSDGKPIEDSIENKARLLDEYPKLFNAVMEEAMNDDNYAIEDDSKVMTDKEADQDTEKN
jgi:hypothetical protein